MDMATEAFVIFFSKCLWEREMSGHVKIREDVAELEGVLTDSALFLLFYTSANTITSL